MISKTRLIISVQLILIALLAGSIAYLVNNNETEITETNKGQRFLSPRIYSGIIEPKSFLIVNYAPLREEIEQYLTQTKGNVSVYVENMRSGAFIGLNERKGYPPASLNKVTTAMLIMKQVEDGKLSLSSKIPIPDNARSNAFGTLYQAEEKELPLNVLFEKMLKESDDTAFKTLNPLVDPNDRSLLLSYLDYYSDESVDRTKPGEDYPTGLVTTKSMYHLFSSLYLSTILEPASSEYILSLMTNTSFDINTLAELPPDVIVSHKFAMKYDGKEQYLHDCGIMYVDNMRVFYCVMTQGIPRSQAEQHIGIIVNGIYSYVVNTRDTLDQYKDLYGFN